MSNDNKEYSLRYVGKRFNGARLPLDVLADLPAVRDLIAALAKQEYRQEHPEKNRVPQGFDKSISFVLLDINDGSAVPVFALENEVAQQNLPNIGNDMEGIVQRAYMRIAQIFDDASNDVYPDALPQDAISALSRLGNKLQDDEKIEFLGTKGKDGNVVSLDVYRRKDVLTHLRETYSIEFEGVGTLTGLDISHNTIQVKTEKYGELKLSLDDITTPAKQFDGNTDALVEFSLLIALDAHDTFKVVEEVQSVDLIRPYDKDLMKCLHRLQELSKIKKGWLGDHEGEQLIHLAGERATQLIFMRADLANLFKIYPTEDGGVSIEFDKRNWSFAVEIAPDGSLEIDGSAESGEIKDSQSFKKLSPTFFEAFDNMISEAFNDKN